MCGGRKQRGQRKRKECASQTMTTTTTAQLILYRIRKKSVVHSTVQWTSHLVANVDLVKSKENRCSTANFLFPKAKS